MRVFEFVVVNSCGEVIFRIVYDVDDLSVSGGFRFEKVG